MWLLLVLFVVDGNIDFSYRLQDNVEICEKRRDTTYDYISIYGRNVEHIEAVCVNLETGELRIGDAKHD